MGHAHHLNLLENAMQTIVKLSLPLFALGLIHTLPAHAELESRLGGQAVYDTVHHVTWLTNANLMASNNFGLTYGQDYGNDGHGNLSLINSDGTSTWGGAQKWVAAMNAAHYLGYSDWQLPTTLQPDPTCRMQSGGISFGVGCTGSPMGQLFKELGEVAGQSITTTHNARYGLFTYLRPTVYWSSTEATSNPNDAWTFNASIGLQGANYKSYRYYSLVMRSGDVAPNTGTADR